MQNINSETELRIAILQLETRQHEEAKVLKEQFLVVYDSLKPFNLFKSAFKEVTTSTELKGNILNTSVGMTAGYLSKMVFQGLMKNPFRKLLGTILMIGIENVVANNPNSVKSLGKGFFTLARNMLGGHHTRENNPPRLV